MWRPRLLALFVGFARVQGDDCESPSERLRIGLLSSPVGTTWPPAQGLGSCAIVGTLDDLKGKSLGSDIDSHETVVRVRYLPSETDAADFGSRTTVYFVASPTDEPEVANASGVSARLLGQKKRQFCRWQQIFGCNFAAVVFDSAGTGPRDPLGLTEHLAMTPSSFEVAYQGVGLTRALASFQKLRADRKEQATSPELRAYLTVAPLCSSVKLFGFFGDKTLDGHAPDASHDRAAERAWLKRMLAGKIRAEDFALTGAMALDPPTVQIVPRLMRRLSCQALAGKSSIAGTKKHPKYFRPWYWAPPGVKQGAATGRLDGLVTSLFPEQPFPDRLGTCAFIGSGKELSGKGRGDEIDAHDTVIRINRLSLPKYANDIGIKTSIFFINNSPWFHETGAMYKYVGAHGSAPDYECPWNVELAPPGADYKKLCPWDAVLFDRNGMGFDWKDRFKLMERLHMNSSYPVGYMGDGIGYAMWSFEAMKWKSKQYVMSGGLKAFLSLAPLCDSVSMYGFVGSGNIDHHYINSWHDYGLEHKWLHRIAQGNVLAADFTSNGGAKAERQVYKTIPRLMDSLLDLAQAGRIRIVGANIPPPAPVQAMWSASIPRAAGLAGASTRGLVALAACLVAFAAVAVARRARRGASEVAQDDQAGLLSA